MASWEWRGGEAIGRLRTNSIDNLQFLINQSVSNMHFVILVDTGVVTQSSSYASSTTQKPKLFFPSKAVSVHRAADRKNKWGARKANSRKVYWIRKSIPNVLDYFDVTCWSTVKYMQMTPKKTYPDQLNFINTKMKLSVKRSPKRLKRSHKGYYKSKIFAFS